MHRKTLYEIYAPIQSHKICSTQYVVHIPNAFSVIFANHWRQKCEIIIKKYESEKSRKLSSYSDLVREKKLERMKNKKSGCASWAKKEEINHF